MTLRGNSVDEVFESIVETHRKDAEEERETRIKRGEKVYICESLDNKDCEKVVNLGEMFLQQKKCTMLMIKLTKLTGFIYNNEDCSVCCFAADRVLQWSGEIMAYAASESQQVLDESSKIEVLCRLFDNKLDLQENSDKSRSISLMFILFHRLSSEMSKWENDPQKREWEHRYAKTIYWARESIKPILIYYRKMNIACLPPTVPGNASPSEHLNYFMSSLIDAFNNKNAQQMAGYISVALTSDVNFIYRVLLGAFPEFPDNRKIDINELPERIIKAENQKGLGMMPKSRSDELQDFMKTKIWCALSLFFKLAAAIAIDGILPLKDTPNRMWLEAVGPHINARMVSGFKMEIQFTHRRGQIT